MTIIFYARPKNDVKPKNKITIDGVTYVQIYLNNFKVMTSYEIINKYIDLRKTQTDSIKNFIADLRKNELFNKVFENLLSPAEIIYILDTIDYDEDQFIDDDFDQMEVKRKASTNKFINHKYTNSSYQKFDNSDECFLNAFLNKYDHKFKATNKQKHCDRETLLKLLNKSEEDVKNGVSLNEMIKIFNYYNVTVRAFDVHHRTIYERMGNNGSGILSLLLKDEHVYLMNHDEKAIAYEKAKEYDLIVSNKFQIPKERQQSVYMIKSYADLYKICQEQYIAPGRDERILINFVYDGNLNDLLFDFKNNGVEPSIRTQGLKITGFGFHFFKTKEKDGCIAMIRDQDPNIDLTDDAYTNVDQQDTYLKMYDANQKFRLGIFNKNHLSILDENDKKMMNFKTMPQVGILDAKVNKKDCVEIDISKAYTSAFKSITHVPVFNVFDKWQPYNNEPIRNYNLYLVKGKASLFFQKSHQLCFGMYVKKFNDLQVLYVKRPSNVYKVDYKKLVDDLWATDIDAVLKKNIANVNIGIMEKSTNKASHSFLFESFKECKASIKAYRCCVL